jgi:hypothetical protein
MLSVTLTRHPVSTITPGPAVPALETFGDIEHVVKSIPHILALGALLAVYHTAGVLWGRDAKVYILIGMLALYGVAGVTLFIMRRRLRAGVHRMDAASRADLLREHPEVAEELAPSATVPWLWRVLDTVLGITFAFGPPVIVSLVRKQPLTWESECTGYHLAAMAGGIGVYLLGRAFVIRQWQRRNAVQVNGGNGG